MRAAVDAVDAFQLTLAALHTRSSTFDHVREIGLVAAGKAAWPMARAAASLLDARIAFGVVSGPRADGALPKALEWIAGGHPAPDRHSIEAASRALRVASLCGERGAVLLALFSGGGSAMLALPAEGITLEQKRDTVDALSRAGRPIAEINCVRKHLSTIKGGRLAAAAGGPCVTLAVSDVHEPADDTATIASGPTVADPSTFRDAVDVIDGAGCDVPDAVRTFLRRGAAGEIAETLKPGDPRLRSSTSDVIGNRHTAMAGALRAAKERGYAVRVVEQAVVGDAATAGARFVERALSATAALGQSCVIASGETTVTVRGGGRGGRNQEFAAGAAGALAAHAVRAVVCSAGTDGIDGPTDAAGAIVTSASHDQALAMNVSLEAALARNDTYTALDALGALIRWGPTYTNVGDVHLLLKA